VKGLIVRGNFLEAQVYHLELPSGSDAYVAEVDWNWHYSLMRLSGVSGGDNDTILTEYPFTDWENSDFTILPAYRGQGWPTEFLPARGDDGSITTPTEVDRGCSQHRQPVSGSIPARILASYATPTGWTCQLLVLGGSMSGAQISLPIATAQVPASGEPLTDLATQAVIAALRDGTGIGTLVGQEVLI
jgi:hypothetical protein